MAEESALSIPKDVFRECFADYMFVFASYFYHMERSLQQYYKWNEILLSIIGLWPYQDKWSGRIIRGTLTFILILSTCAQVADFIVTTKTVDYVIDIIPVIVPTVGAVVQIYTRLLHLSDMKILMERIKIDWTLSTSLAECKILHQRSETARMTTIIFMLYVTTGVVGYTFFTILPQIIDVIYPLNISRAREHPFNVEFFVDKNKYFCEIQFFIFIVFAIVGVIFVANGSIYVVYVQHACAKFSMIRYRLELLCHTIRVTEEDDNTDRKQLLHRSIMHIVKDHQNAIQFADITESCYTLSFLIELVGILVVMSTTLVQIMGLTMQSDRSGRSAAFIVAQFIYLYLCSYMGQELIDTSMGLFEELYNSAWYNIEVREQKLILLIMKRSIKPLTLTAWGVYVMSLERFGMIIQSAVSVCMVIRQL